MFCTEHKQVYLFKKSASYTLEQALGGEYISNNTNISEMNIEAVKNFLNMVPEAFDTYNECEDVELKNEMKQISSLSFKILGVLISMGIGFFLGAYFLGDKIIQLLFKRGEFTFFDVEMTYLALQGYAISLVFLLPQKYFNSLFFAISKTSMVLTTGALALIINLILNYYFIFELDLGHYGLALATSVSSIVVFCVSIFWLFKQKILMV